MWATVVEYYNDVLYNKSDPRVQNLFLMNSLTPTVLLCVAYISAVVVIGPKLMQNRNPVNLQYILMVYNVAQILLSGYIFYEAVSIGWLTKFSVFRCQSVDFSENPKARREIGVIYLYFLSKFTEFLDTIFFVLRKKNSQITFLHVYHHVSMPIYIWLMTKYYPGGSLTIVAFVNSFIHVIMYVYYFLAGLGPHMQKYLWWKKYLTVMQLIQFLTGTMHMVIVFFSNYNNKSTCNISMYFAFIYVFVGAFFFLLFNNFYNKVYQKKISEINGTKKENYLINGSNKKNL